eukprot:2200067-Pleurochrysis_carterae.AAC.1
MLTASNKTATMHKTLTQTRSGHKEADVESTMQSTSKTLGLREETDYGRTTVAVAHQPQIPVDSQTTTAEY